MTIPSLQEA